MERNSCDIAFRCLEVAVHPNTGDQEALAAIAGYRRTAGGASLADLCLQFARDAHPAASDERAERLARENRLLRRELGRAKAGEIAALRRAEAAEQRADAADAELHAARERADAAEYRLAEAALAHDEITDGLRHAIFDLRSALNHARRQPAPSFRDVLAAASEGSAPRPVRYPVMPERHSQPSRSPWTA
ncbi:MAG TPA: hypothetical protein VND87_04365 [Stellaceae bacterium]|nr:hypothetical protein [Stellaceae bacterium]